MGLLDDFLANQRRGLLDTPEDQIPPAGPVAPLFVPPIQTSYPEPTSGDSWNTAPSWFSNAIARASTPESADHGLAERQKLSPLQKAVNPIISYPENYLRMNLDNQNQMLHGWRQITQPDVDQTSYPATGSEFDAVSPHGLSNITKGVGNIALGAAGYVSSPLDAAIRSVVSQPIEDVTGIPREYIEQAAQAGPAAFGAVKYFRNKFAAAPSNPATGVPLALPTSEGQVAQELANKTLVSAVAPNHHEMPWLADRYPETAQPVEKHDSGNSYMAKQYSREELQLKEILDAVQKDIDAGNYDPYFDVAKRFSVDRAHYQPMIDTQNIRAASINAQANHEAIARNPEAVQRIEEAFDKGLRQKENARDWSALGQIEEKFIKEYGPEEGRKLFKRRFADGIATTSPGATPRANVRMALFGNYMDAKGAALPNAAYDIPFPAGTRFGVSNLKQFRKAVMEGSGLTPATPKMYNFSNDMLGGTGGVIDRHIYRLFDPELNAPPPGSYGHYESALADLAAKHGVELPFFKDMVWAGAREHLTKPLIQEFNESIERTHRVTGMPRDEVVRRGLIRAEIPMFGAGGIIGGKAFSTNDDGSGRATP